MTEEQLIREFLLAAQPTKKFATIEEQAALAAFLTTEGASQSVHYPILPDIRRMKARQGSTYARREFLHIRHHSLFAPRDFDLSPYFQIVKLHLFGRFDPHLLEGSNGSAADATPDEEDGAKEEAGADRVPVEEPEAACQRVLFH